MKTPQRLLCCALAVMMSSTGWASEKLPTDKDGQPVYVRFVADYAPVGCPDELGFKAGDVAMIRKVFDANYFEVARPPQLVSPRYVSSPEEMKENWIKFAARRHRIRRDKVEIIPEEEAILAAILVEATAVANTTAVDKMLSDHAAEQRVAIERRARMRRLEARQTPQPVDQSAQVSHAQPAWQQQQMRQSTDENSIRPDTHGLGANAVRPNAYGLGINADQFGRPHTYRTRDGESVGIFQEGVRRDAYGLGVHSDSFGRAVYDSVSD